MSHYAKVSNGIVTQVIVADETFFKNFVDSSPGIWIKTSYNTRGGIHYDSNGLPDDDVALRANFAFIGCVYDAVNDVFYASRPMDRSGIPCASWTISAPNWTWTPPIPSPIDGKSYAWDEQTKTWNEKI
jgi:hypothetical protein